MQWNTTENAGFSDSGVETWLQVQANYIEINVESARKKPNSLLNVYRKPTRLKTENPALHHGSLELWEEELPPEILAYTRKSDIEEVLMVLNFQINFSWLTWKG